MALHVQSSFISFMKLRASWGKNGSLANLYPGAWRSAIGFGNAYPDADGNVVPLDSFMRS